MCLIKLYSNLPNKYNVTLFWELFSLKNNSTLPAYYVYI